MNNIVFEKSCCFESERLKYRGINIDDSPNMVAWRSRPDIYQFSSNANPVTLEEHLAWFNGYALRMNEIRTIITDKASNADVGMVGGIWENQTLILSYYIGETQYRGKGFAGEAIKALMTYVCNVFGIHSFEAHILPTNIASIACVEKLGFKRNGESGTNITYRLEKENCLETI
jgi:ribosomal-protein-alanine N-acetyltransferase